MPESTLSTVRDLKTLSAGATGRPFQSLLLLKRVSGKTASNGNPFLSLDLGDRSGVFSCNIFSDNPAFEAVKALSEGTVLRIEGKIETYQGRFSPRISRAAPLGEAELADPALIAGLVESTPEDPRALAAELLAFVESISHPELRATVTGVLDELGETFRSAPAAISMHHAYRHGLLEHTVRMARAVKALHPLYPEVDRDLAMAGVIVHDSGKALEYEGALAPRRTRRGLLQGHVVLGYQLVRKAGLKARLDSDRLERLEHIVLSHQGQLEWGAAVMAATPEAVLVSLVDNLDAKMGMVQRALRQAAEGEEFSERLPGLESALLTRPPTAG